MDNPLVLHAENIMTNQHSSTGLKVHFLNLFNFKNDCIRNIELGQEYDGIQIHDESGEHVKYGPIMVQEIIFSNNGKHCMLEISNGTRSFNGPHVDMQYLSAAQDILENGTFSDNRTDTGTQKLFGHMMKFDQRIGLPVLTTKHIDTDNIAKELAWLLRGEDNVNSLKADGCNIWNGWATDAGDLGPVYGVQWRCWDDIRLVDCENGGQNVEDFLSKHGYELINQLGDSGKFVYKKKYDQIAEVIDSLKNNPNDRRMLVTGLNPGYTPVTSIEISGEERLEFWLKGEIAQLEADELWVQQQKEHAENPNNTVPIGAREFALSNLYSTCVHESASPNWDPENDPDHLEILLNEINAPTTRPFAPKENAAVGQQALPPCHMIFQLGTAPMTLKQREQMWVDQREQTLLNDDLWRDEVGVEEFDLAWVAKSQAQQELVSLFGDNRPADEDDVMMSAEDKHTMLTNAGIPEYYLDLAMYQRSADWFLGVPYNIASYSMMLCLFAKLTNMVARNFVHMFGDYHIYDNHREQILEQMNNPIHPMPTLTIRDIDDIDDITWEHFEVHNYIPGPKIRGKVAI